MVQDLYSYCVILGNNFHPDAAALGSFTYYVILTLTQLYGSYKLVITTVGNGPGPVQLLCDIG